MAKNKQSKGMVESIMTTVGLEDMRIHERIILPYDKGNDPLITVLRVYNGWIYSFDEGAGSQIQYIFVPQHLVILSDND